MSLYTLAGRAALGESAHGPCIFCGTMLTHVSDGGNGWLLGAVVDEETQFFMYCRSNRCGERAYATKAEPPYGPIWRCGCEADYVESVGEWCHMCHRPRSSPVPYGCGSCNTKVTDMTAEEHYESCPRNG